MKIYIRLFTIVIFLTASYSGFSQNKHSKTSAFKSYQGLVMAGYQGWFRAEGDGSESGWQHYQANGKLDKDNIHIDLWPDVSEYPKTYNTGINLKNGKPALLFSSWDKSTTDLHFKWMKDYNIDGVFIQRFFSGIRTAALRKKSNKILSQALNASIENNRAIAVMYDLSGLKATGENCDAVIEDWKQLVDSLKITSRGNHQTYLYQNNKPLVAIWGLGFPDRPFNIRNIGVDKLIDFLKNDPIYGGCSVMLGVPNYFRELKIDCLPDPYLHELIRKADMVMPWTVQRFTPLLHAEKSRYENQVKADIEWCKINKVEYVPCVYPGFSWHNLSKVEFGGIHPVAQIPRQKGKFYWDLMSASISAGGKMLYVAMFDEMDEGTAIFKIANELPQANFKMVDNEGMPSDYYLWLTGQANEMLKKQIPFTNQIPERK
nr:glycoside hydrolase family 71/99-like protein [uncultured Pedobacter sp.]